MADQLTSAQFAASIKAKYPDYANVPDDELATKMLAKYPEYRDRVSVDAPANEPASAGTRFVSGMASQLNPIAAAEGIGHAVAHPLDTLAALIDSHVDQAKKAKQAYDEGRYSEAAGHLGAAALPVVGPVAAGIGERIADTGDIATGVGEGVGLASTVFAPRLVPKATGATLRAGESVINTGKSALTSDVGQAVAGKVLKHGATVTGAVAGGSVGGAPGAFLGGTVGRELGASLVERLKAHAAASKVPLAAADADVVADLTSGRPMGAATVLEKLKTLPADAREAVVKAREANKAGATAAETPIDLSRRLKTENQARYAQAAAGDVPVAAETAAPAAADVAPQAQPATPATALKSPARVNNELALEARRAKVKLTDEDYAALRPAVAQGLPAAEAIKALKATVEDPAAELARRLGTPSVEEMTARVQARNANGQWERPKATVKAKRDVASENRYQELLARYGGTGH